MTNTVKSSRAERPAYDLLIGTTKLTTPQFANIGTDPLNDNRRIAVDLNNINTFFLTGVQGSGKSTVIQVLAESCCREVPGLNKLPAAPCVIGIHYTRQLGYRPEAINMRFPNAEPGMVTNLHDMWKAAPAGISDIVVLAPRHMVDKRRAEYRGREEDGPPIEVLPITLGLNQLSIDEVQILMGAVGEDDSEYMQIINLILEEQEGKLTLDGLEQQITISTLNANDKRTALNRLRTLRRFVADTADLGSVLKNGRYVSVDLRDPALMQTAAFRLIIVMMRVFARTRTAAGTLMPKMLILDEFHVYARNAALVEALELAIRMMRHDATSVVLASQEPIRVDPILIELASIVIVNKCISPRWKHHLAGVIPAFGQDGFTIADLITLGPGQAWLWTRDCYDTAIPVRPVRINIRPPFTMPGGSTKTATSQLSPPRT